MMLSFTCVSVAVVLLVETLCASVVFFVVVFSPLLDTTELRNAERIARSYAQLASNQAGIGPLLDPERTFAPNNSVTLIPVQGDTNNPDVTNTVPYITFPYPGSQLAPFALLIAPDGSVLASSEPRAYPIHVPAVTILSSRYSLLAYALKGEGEKLIAGTATGRIGLAFVPVFNQSQQLIGAVYVQLPPEVSTSSFFTNFAAGFLLPALILLFITIPLGAVFSLITTRGRLGRMQRLVDATTQLASGDYRQHVQITSADEFGLLERQFNLLAEQLVESIEQRYLLTEQNTRLAERARIFRDLHDGVKQQAFALTMQISTALTLMDTQPEAVRTHLQNSEALAYQVQQELTALIQSSRPSLLSEKGLATALQVYLTTWSWQQQIPVQQHLDTCTLPPLMEEALLRITQEALSNIARHSRASAVTLDLSCTQDRVTLMLEDNGCGFDQDDPALALKNGLGLQSMHERIKAFHGTLHIESSYGGGTRIVVYCPHPHYKESHGEAQFTAPLLPDKKVI
jgi:NarL family two-component system sensor histidine kinase LiaS